MSYFPQMSGGTPGWNDPPPNVAANKGGSHIRRSARPIDPSILGDGNYGGPPQQYGQQPSAGPQYGGFHQGYKTSPSLEQPRFGQPPSFGQTRFGQPPSFGQLGFGQPPSLGQPRFGQPQGQQAYRAPGVNICQPVRSAGPNASFGQSSVPVSFSKQFCNIQLQHQSNPQQISLPGGHQQLGQQFGQLYQNVPRPAAPIDLPNISQQPAYHGGLQPDGPINCQVQLNQPSVANQFNLPPQSAIPQQYSQSDISQKVGGVPNVPVPRSEAQSTPYQNFGSTTNPQSLRQPSTSSQFGQGSGAQQVNPQLQGLQPFQWSDSLNSPQNVNGSIGPQQLGYSLTSQQQQLVVNQQSPTSAPTAPQQVNQYSGSQQYDASGRVQQFGQFPMPVSQQSSGQNLQHYTDNLPKTSRLNQGINPALYAQHSNGVSPNYGFTHQGATQHFYPESSGNRPPVPYSYNAGQYFGQSHQY